MASRHYRHHQVRTIYHDADPTTRTTLPSLDLKTSYIDTVTTPAMVTSYEQHAHGLSGIIGRFAFVTSKAVPSDIPRDVLTTRSRELDRLFHLAKLKL